MQRRRFLSAGIAGGFAVFSGCVGFLDRSQDSNRTSNGGQSNHALALTLFHHDGPLRNRYVTDLTETPPDWDEKAFTATLNGSIYTTQQHKPFFSSPDDPVYAKHDGRYYRLGSVVIDEVTTTHPVLRLFRSDQETEVTGSSQLPESDQRAIRIAQMAARARGNTGGVPWGLVQRGGYVFRNKSAINESQLLTSRGPDYVSYRDQVYEVAIAKETFHEPVYRATVAPVADSSEQMETVLRAKFVDARFSREDRSKAAREVLRKAQTENGYRESHPYSSGYEEVLRALHQRAYLDGNIRKDAGNGTIGEGIVRYDREYFEYHLRFQGEVSG